MAGEAQSRRGAAGRRGQATGGRTPPAPPRGEGRAPWLGLGRTNAILLAAGVGAIVAGYVLLDRGSITAAPLLLILGYVVLIPAALVVGLRRERSPGE